MKKQNTHQRKKHPKTNPYRYQILDRKSGIRKKQHITRTYYITGQLFCRRQGAIQCLNRETENRPCVFAVTLGKSQLDNFKWSVIQYFSVQTWRFACFIVLRSDYAYSGGIIVIELLKTRDKVIGAKQTRKLAEQGRLKTVFIANDADQRVVGPIKQICESKGITVYYVDTMKQLGKAAGIDVGAAVAGILDN